MKHLQKLPFFLFVLTLCITALACKPATPKLTIPYTEMTWNNTLEDIQSAEGELLSTSPSAYNGTTYVFEKEFLDVKGNIKYSFDEKNTLKSIGWMYSSASIDELEALYKKICSETANHYGECDLDTADSSKLKSSAVKANFWYLDDGNIQILLIYAADYSVLQIQYIHPDVASENPNLTK